MRRTASLLLLAAAAAVATAAPAQAFTTKPAAPATASTSHSAAGSADMGAVVVFSSELQTLDVYPKAPGCQKLPITSHVLDNMTSAPIMVYADPFCTFPAALPSGKADIGSVGPGFGTHVTGAGSFMF